MKKTQSLGFRKNYLLLTILFSSLFVSACGTMLAPESTTPPPEDNRKQALRCLAMAETVAPADSYPLRLKAAEQYMKAEAWNEARQVIRDIQEGEYKLDLQSRTTLLETRLALLHNDNHRAQVMLSQLLAPFANNPNFMGGARASQKIALLLPSAGPHAEAAKTIKDGFLAAYYKTLQRNAADAKVQVYDTGTGNNVEAVYQKALAEKADFIVGPLTKAEVQAIAGIKLDVPVLALNSIHDAKANKKTGKLYQFGLMPEDEIASIIENARKRGHKRVLLIMPANDWGQRMSDTFQHLWAYRGGEIIATIQINAKDDLTTQLQTALEKPSKNQKQADMIFLIANAELARQVKPLISYYHKQTLPIYATSAVYTGHPAPNKDQDLNGIHFCDMPWVLNPSAVQDKSLLADLWPSSPDNPRYFALGMDAYQLAAQLSQTGFPIAGIQGSTGLLHKEGQRIQRQLVCAKFEQGVPVPD